MVRGIGQVYLTMGAPRLWIECGVSSAVTVFSECQGSQYESGPGFMLLVR